MEKLKCIKKCLVEKVQEQISHLDCVDTKELGEVIDMIKDLEETMYYCVIIKAMEEKEDHYNHMEYYTDNKHMDEDEEKHEGKSCHSRKDYMEAKWMHHDKVQMMKHLEKYIQDLTIDIAEMIEDSSLEEKQLLQKRFGDLAKKIETL